MCGVFKDIGGGKERNCVVAGYMFVALLDIVCWMIHSLYSLQFYSLLLVIRGVPQSELHYESNLCPTLYETLPAIGILFSRN